MNENTAPEPSVPENADAAANPPAAASAESLEPLVLPEPEGAPPGPVEQTKAVKWLTPVRAGLAAAGIAVLGITGGAGVGFAIGSHVDHPDHGRFADRGSPGGPSGQNGPNGPNDRNGQGGPGSDGSSSGSTDTSGT